jgi:integrase
MKKQQFTEKWIQSIKPRAVKFIEREGRGFAIQVSPAGTKTFLYLFEKDKVRTQINLGTYPAMSLAGARASYHDHYKLVKGGINPREHKKAAAEAIELKKTVLAREVAKDKAIRENTFASLVEDGIPEGFIPATVGQLAAVYYCNYSATHHTKGVQRNLLYALRKEFLNELGHKNIIEVRRGDAIALIDKLASKSPGQAGNVLKAGRQVFEYALQRGWAEIQPFLAVPKAVPKAISKPRERTLSDDEIRQVWKEVLDSDASKEAKNALLLLLVTAQREGEIVQMQRCQIDGRWWTIPATVAKNRREHRVYLSDLALELIGDNGGYIFPSTHSGKAHIAGNSLAQIVNRGKVTDEVVKRVGNRNIKARENKYFGMERWTPHDLRRTARTNMSRIGVSDEVAEEVINHKKSKLVGTYNKYGYETEKQEALIKWGGFLRGILKLKKKNSLRIIHRSQP